MTQTNNEREAFELSISMEYEHPTDLTRDGDGYSDGYVDNAWWGWCKALHYSKSPISQNEQQESVTNLWEALGKWSAYLASNGEQANLAPPSWLIDAVSSATSPHKQSIPDGGYQAATKASESEINALKERVEELQADNNKLREELENTLTSLQEIKDKYEIQK